MSNWEKGRIQVYTGNGKGKTTAALGLTLRAVGAGMKVYFAQFIKGRDCAEINGLRMLGDLVTLERFGSGRWIDRNKIDDYREELELGRKGIVAVKEAVESDRYDIVILDEALGAINKGVIDINDILSVIENKPERLEIVLTGRNIPERLLECADLVSEINPLKHYYDAGVVARKGIEY